MEVGLDEKLVPDVVQDIAVRFEPGDEEGKFRPGRFEGFPVQLRSRRSGADRQESVFLVLADADREVEKRILRVLVNENVFLLGVAELVIEHLLELVFGRQLPAGRGLVITAVEEPVLPPGGSGEFHPADPVGKLGLGGDVHHPDLAPIRSGFPAQERHFRLATGGAEEIDLDGSIGRKRVRIDEHLGRPLEAFLNIDDGLVLKPVVLGEEIMPADPERRRVPGIVVDFHQPLLQRPAEGDLFEMAERHGILGLDPSPGLGRTVVFKPAVGVGDFRPEIIVDLVDGLGHGVRHLFRLLTEGSGGQRQGRRQAPKDRSFIHQNLLDKRYFSFYHFFALAGSIRRRSRPRSKAPIR
ncbi:MAG: hypothetical protein BWX98_02486 [Candidatus Aminicenantes bacterium ADurb.Bin147]|nr:MAG: hypothetical protein BWX98_02486 [Candidatus Aminicenantes bacterium ADurb.Bin147]